MSDYSALSDIHRSEHVPVVRFISVIGQPSKRTCSGCPIHRSYRTTIETNVLQMSDSAALSDNIQSKCSKHNGEARKLDNHMEFIYFTQKTKTNSIRVMFVFVFLVLLNILCYSFMCISSSDSTFFLPNSRFSKNIFKNSLFCFSPW